MNATIDAAESLSAKLGALPLSQAELRVLDALLAGVEYRATAPTHLVVAETLIPSPVQRAIVARTAAGLRCDVPTATRAFADALTYLEASGRGYGIALSPSPMVDEAWHQFLLFTVDYARYCGLTAGRFIHHVPNVGDHPEMRDGLGWPETFTFLTDRGHPLDPELWATPTVAQSLAHLLH